jgi:hypothetical protein
MTTVSVELPQPAPTLVRTHAPSRLPPPPPLRRGARLGSSALGLLRRAGGEGSVPREPDNDFSSLPTLPPALPCARASVGKATTASVAESSAALVTNRIIPCIMHRFPMSITEAATIAVLQYLVDMLGGAAHKPEIVHLAGIDAPLLYDGVVLSPALPGRLLRWRTASCLLKSSKKNVRGSAPGKHRGQT